MKLPDTIKAIKDKPVDNDDKAKAEMIFSTVHRSKGMEYDAIQIVNDFITEEKLIQLKDDNKNNAINFTKLNEEINLLYVAVTRRRNSIYLPEPLVPCQFPKSTQIYVLKVLKDGEKNQPSNAAVNPIDYFRKNKEKSNSPEHLRSKNENGYMLWTNELDNELTIMFCEGISVEVIEKILDEQLEQ